VIILSYAHRITKATFSVIVFSIAAAVLGYVLKLYLARNLSVEDFGLFYAVLSLTSLLFLLKDFGLSQALAKYLPEFNHGKDYTSTKSAIASSYIFQLAAGVILAIIFYFASDYLALNLFHSQQAKAVLLIMLAEFVLAATTVKFTLQGMLLIKSYALMEVLRIIFVFVPVVFLVQLGAAGVAMSYLAASLAVQIIFSLYIISKTRKLPGSARIFRSDFNRLFRFGSYFMFGGIAGFLISYTDTLVLTALRALGEVGLYQAAISTSQVLWGIALALSVVLMPVISEMWAKNEKDKVSRGVGFLIKYVMIILIPAMLLMVAFSEIVINILFGHRYIQASTSLQVLAFGAIFYSIMTIYSTSLASIGRPDAAMKITVVAGVFNLAANIVMVQAMGIFGAAVATSAAYVLGFVLYHRYFGHVMNVNVHKKDLAKIMAGALTSLLIVYALKELIVIDVVLESVLTVVIALSFYAVFVLKSGIIKMEDIEIIRASRLPVPRRIMNALE
jgi:O-antigen/teichoic acid export membrane protein